MTLTFRSPGNKFHHSVWYFLTRYVLVLFSLTFVLSGGLELVSSSSFFPWVSLQESYHHIACHSLRCCPVSNSVSLVSPPKLPDWDPLYCFDIPLMWHPLESLLSINFTTSNESFLFDAVVAVSANGIWNMISMMWYDFVQLIFNCNWQLLAKLWFGVGRKWKLLEQKALIDYFKVALMNHLFLLLHFHQTHNSN